MHRINIYLKDEQLEFFKHKEGTISENLRNAIDWVMNQEEKSKVSSSKSERGDKNE